jgi:hypothetical protein
MRIFSMLRAARAPDELRICSKCEQPHLEQGWILVRTFIPLKGGQPKSFLCWACLSNDDQGYKVVSRTGEPVELDCCDECAEPLLKDGWRKACVRGS